ncbi:MULTISPECIES: winged helix-turn-helix domain-containing protein [Pectobacterium]|uniref:winged helix-turn-helix domain-containing protein n=1 Tax=Pectobacterium TaxID=122277 RepID=UPI0004E62046|nr:winged helix-turn-helix domain-containing protein [Pectobacterium brasiliense]KFF66113.1 CadC family transcriptional regulator [Pectobacterium brasiliense]KHS89751.1 CadC family transcriptional regulator [Pectobacterium brasiliense]KHT25946.1 CadC family transcriptional regulator [Pectobacterium brasiliense]MBN3056639.1 winged helix-turn-helix domain-containing protein [Pectobacterium brasiliense]MBN3144337.1 winged helix-turn-helix domain-containing protein [Pectobacterium brasiliense]
MVYLINDLIIFNEGEGTLAWIERENEAISLSFPISRLLCLLIENQGVTLSRDFLLKEALEKHALCPSLNNLNNYLSLLRKVLREFDLSDSIVTIPKLGIVFNVESIVSYPTADGGEEETLNQGGEKNVEEESDEEKKPFSIKHLAIPEPVKKQQYIRFLLIWTMIAGIFLLALGNVNRFPYRHLVDVKMSGKCDLFYLYDSVGYPLPTDYENLCSDNTLFFLSKKIVISGMPDKKSEIVISCKKDGNGCVTYVNN